MKNYYAVENKLFTLTDEEEEELNKLYGETQTHETDEHFKKLRWIEQHGKHIGEVTTFNY